MGLNSLSIRAKLLLGFSLISALIAFVGVRGIQSAGRLNANIEELGDRSFANTQLIMEIKEYEDSWHRAVLNHVLFVDQKQMDEQAKKMKVRSDSLFIILAELKGRVG